MKKLGIVWIIDNDIYIEWILKHVLSSIGIECIFFNKDKKLIDAMINKYPDVLILNIHMSNINGLNLFHYIKQNHPKIPIIMMTEYSNIDVIVSAYQQGAFDCLPKPFDIDQAIKLIKQAIDYNKQIKNIKNNNIIKFDFTSKNKIIGESIAMQNIFRIIGRLSRSSISVLINGESGTGKELIAKALHHYSPRNKQPFIALNMAAIPTDLIESELFGHEKGAFTGANQIRKGRFEQADKGTLFLDEIGDMPIDVQTRLLRVLVDGKFYRVGGCILVKVNVRIIAATHQNLNLRIKEGKFREDLFYRLNVIKLHLPPLRERREDIPYLAHYFLQLAAKELSVQKKTLHPDTEIELTRFNWSGNVRQLENICRWITLMISNQEILIQDLPIKTFELHYSKTNNLYYDNWVLMFTKWINHELKSGNTNLVSKSQLEIDRILLTTTLCYTNGHKKKAATLLGLGRNTLTNKLKKLGIKV